MLSKAARKYVDQLMMWLRLRDVSGEQTGEIAAEVEAHIAATGESAREAFGPARQYAARRAPRRSTAERRRRWWVLLLAGVTGLLIGWMLAESAEHLRSGEPLFGLPPGWAVAVSLLVALIGSLVLPIEAIRDPRPGASLFAARWKGVAFLWGIFLLIFLAHGVAHALSGGFE